MTTTAEIADWVAAQKAEGKTIVLASGCFDVLHLGHIRHLREAREIGDGLVIAINADASVRRLKGPGRPVFPDVDRAEALRGLRYVDGVVIMEGDHAGWAIRTLKPSVWVKGNDYSPDNIHPDETAALQEVGAWPLFIRRIPGVSTSSILNQLSACPRAG